MKQWDIIVIGSGITGTALSRQLSRYRASVLVLDSKADIAEGATKANSGIVHAGYDAVPGTKKAYYNIRGASMYSSLCEELHVPYKNCGALVIGFDERDRDTLHHLLKRGKINGVQGLRLISKDEALQKEPSLNPDIVCALDVPTSAIMSPYEMAFAMADDAALNGIEFSFGETVSSVRKETNGSWLIGTDSGKAFSCRSFVNCAGSSGAVLHNLISEQKLNMIHRRGQYYLLDRLPVLPFSRTVFQCPSAMGKGVLVTPTVHGNLLIGPNAEDIDDPCDTATTAEGLSSVLQRASRTWPGLSVRTNITNFSGIRAHLESDDFLIGQVAGSPGAFEAIGIESPGLSSAPAVAKDLAEEIVSYLGLSPKEKIIPVPDIPSPFRDMTDEERNDAVRKNPQYGNIVCRCETVTEAEIRQAIRRPVGARTIDGVKRRTRAGMGRCQGGFCCPRVAQIISEESGVPLAQITKDGGKSLLLAGSLESFMKGEDEK